jgi:hypothetical protein
MFSGMNDLWEHLEKLKKKMEFRQNAEFTGEKPKLF